MTKPKPLDLDSAKFENKIVEFENKLNELIELCKEHLDNLTEEDNDMEHYIYEKAMELCYGEDVWDYINDTNK